ncbi:MAG: ETEC_3214 domain-containing protein [Pseudomonadota bacterium]|jgi:hypothetical protein|nr:ETEC_3214 domain-containing protein [Pseudomonadota bacterium]
MEYEATEKPRFFKRAYSTIVAVSLFLISIGQWSDTKQVSFELYEAFLKNFTDEVELEKLRHVKVGGNLEAVEKTFGIATLIKPSSTEENLEYRFYPNSKFILTIASSEGFITAYQVISLDNTFNPSLPFSDRKIGLFKFSEKAESFEDYRTDNANLVYFLESHSLGREGLFLNQFISYVGFAADYNDSSSSNQEISTLNQSLLTSGDNKIQLQLKQLRSKLTPNTFSMGDISASTAADMIITRYEYFAYFKEQSE